MDALTNSKLIFMIMKNYWMMLVLFFCFLTAFAQEMNVSGTVTGQDGFPLPGVSIIVVGTTNGTQTDFDGHYSIMASTGQVLRFSYIGQKTVERTIGTAPTINIQMEDDAQALDEVVVTGVAGATSRKKLSVTVAKVGGNDIQEVVATSAASALQGKVSGVSVNNLGQPGQGANIILRGSTNFYGSQEPLVILDGVFVENGLQDINVDDIESMEIVKGASASSLYGSRAGNGVIVITTKRGKEGKTEVTLRNEIGFTKLTNFVTTNQSHPYKLASDWQSFAGQYTKFEGVMYPDNFQSILAAAGHPMATIGGRTIDDDGYSDNPYGVYNDFQDLIFKEGLTRTMYGSISQGSSKGNVFFSFEDFDYEGVLKLIEGYQRNSYRLNASYQINDWLKFSTSNLFINVNDSSPVDNDDFYRIIMRLSPDANLLATNPDGQPYYFKPDPWENEIDNPLYSLYNTDIKSTQQRFLGGYNLNVKLTSWLNADLEYTFESDNYRYSDNNKFDSFQDDGSEIGFGYSKGSLYKSSSYSLAQKAQATLNFAKEVGELELKGKLSYLNEDIKYESFYSQGTDYLYPGIPSLDNFDSDNLISGSDFSQTIAQNFFAIGGLVFKDRYILDGLYRKDGSSLFGENYKWNDYYRLSGAYRLSEDFKIPGVDEFKINFAIGTAGQRPGFEWQYEQIEINNGSLDTDRIKGNPDLRPSLTEEMEVGANLSMFNGRLNFEGAYSQQKTSDQFMLVSLFPPANEGKNRQWQNVGDLEANTYEASLNATVISNKNFSWNLGLNFATTENVITKLNAPEQQVGSQDLFLLREGIEFGTMWGRVFVEDLETMTQQLPDGGSITDYVVNSDGVVVLANTIGTSDEAPIIKVDEDDIPVFEEIGNQNADFRAGINSTFKYKNLSLYMLWDWKQGGDVYNKNRQWLTISNRTDIVDQSNKPDSEKKTTIYYGNLYDTNNNNKFWVEDGTFVKLREASLSYRLPKKALDHLDFFNEIKLSLIGRNLLTFSKYTGWDPEVNSYSDDTSQYFSVDYGVYPVQTSYSLSIQLKF
ncbi:SusC/RagA family TonB-linked outer membrane protein [Flagellimonas profundi]|uniref:SusC/RagA family TonB-linked outer membrane protein n=1 Tax=Flagellimonas profundi TaxID=2915620 RepID=A0ABS3FJ26_9FLAO|nr:SusC/RagA family TonB-linked outer membrane protein [Allomuricauda profundi]MBO0343154.1 SusC/RagA family TonB-linked outer membrane protein [Allomuricauda profundi]